MIIVQIVERNKGEVQKTWWQIRLPDSSNIFYAIELLTRAIMSVSKKLVQS